MTIEPSHPRSTGALEEIGLYNLLNRIARGDASVDGFLLEGLRQRGYVESHGILTDDGKDELMRLAVRLGWFYPDE